MHRPATYVTYGCEDPKPSTCVWRKRENSKRTGKIPNVTTVVLPDMRLKGCQHKRRGLCEWRHTYSSASSPAPSPLFKVAAMSGALA